MTPSILALNGSDISFAHCAEPAGIVVTPRRIFAGLAEPRSSSVGWTGRGSALAPLRRGLHGDRFGLHEGDLDHVAHLQLI